MLDHSNSTQHKLRARTGSWYATLASFRNAGSIAMLGSGAPAVGLALAAKAPSSASSVHRGADGKASGIVAHCALTVVGGADSFLFAVDSAT